jgi:hypothetical protein
VKAAQLLTKKGLQADKTRKGMSAERGAAADTAAAEEKEERSIAAAEAERLRPFALRWPKNVWLKPLRLCLQRINSW